MATELLTTALTCWGPVSTHLTGNISTREEDASIRNESDESTLNSCCDADLVYDTEYLDNPDLLFHLPAYGLTETYACKCMFTTAIPTPDCYECEREPIYSHSEAEVGFVVPSWFHSGEEETFEMDWEALLEEGAAAGEDVSSDLYPEIVALNELRKGSVDNGFPSHDLYFEQLRCEDSCRKEFQQLSPCRPSFGRQLFWDSISPLEPSEPLCAQKYIEQLSSA